MVTDMSFFYAALIVLGSLIVVGVILACICYVAIKLSK